MPRYVSRVSKKRGLSPGTLVHTGDRKIDSVNIRLIGYDEDTLEERGITSARECFGLRESRRVSWLNIDGLHDTEFIAALGGHFGVHPLVLEDIVNVGQRPKVEDHGDYVFVVFKVFYHEGGEDGLKTEQISLLLYPNLVISFQERIGTVFEPVRERIRGGRGRIRKSGTDYLMYALIDAVVDSYFNVLEKYGEQIESLEEKLLSNPGPETLHDIHRYRREIILLRKSVWPMRELINGLERGRSDLVKDATLPFLRDVYDHTIQVSETLDSFREMISGMLDTYLSSVSNKMNEVMKVLTLIATIFIPLTFIAGVYGMNFEHMPELRWNWIYPHGFWIVIAAVAGFMVYFFRKKKWL